MECPNCGNEVYELLDYAIARCTNCCSLWDPYVYPGFPTPNVEIGEIWDTSEPLDDDLVDGENEEDDDLEEPQDEENEDGENDDDENWDVDGGHDEDAKEEEFDDWDDEES